jgi:AcrR family transcriptional regulator
VSTADARRRLMDAAVETLRDHGIAGASARAIATRAGAAQGLVFYHFNTVAQLIDEACRDATEARVAIYRERFAAIGSLSELLGLGRELHQSERAAGNVQMLAQVLAGAQSDPALAGSARAALELWNVEIRAALRRVLDRSALRGLLDPDALSVTVGAAFIGIELYEGIDPAGAAATWQTLEQLSAIADAVDDLGPVARRAVRARLRRSARRTSAEPSRG